MRRDGDFYDRAAERLPVGECLDNGQGTDEALRGGGVREGRFVWPDTCKFHRWLERCRAAGELEFKPYCIVAADGAGGVDTEDGIGFPQLPDLRLEVDIGGQRVHVGEVTGPAGRYRDVLPRLPPPCW